MLNGSLGREKLLTLPSQLQVFHYDGQRGNRMGAPEGAVMAYILIAVGITLLLIGLLGGGFTFSGSNLPKSASWLRPMASVVGVIVVAAGIALLLLPAR